MDRAKTKAEREKDFRRNGSRKRKGRKVQERQGSQGTSREMALVDFLLKEGYITPESRGSGQGGRRPKRKANRRSNEGGVSETTRGVPDTQPRRLEKSEEDTAAINEEDS